MKKIIAISLMVAMFISNMTTFAEEEIKVFLNEKKIEFEVDPIIIDGTTFVPMRKIFEELGADVKWAEEIRSVIAVAPGVTLVLNIDERKITRNSIEQEVEAYPFIKDGNTMVPLRIVSEYMGCDVNWDGNTKTIDIKNNGKIKSVEWNEKFIYWGECRDGKPDGYGIIQSKENGFIRASGIFDSNNILMGAIYTETGDILYGEYKEGKLEGKGEYWAGNGERYKGEFKNGLYDGYGLYVLEEGEYYIGNFKEGQYEGQGEFHFKNGDYYIGEFKKGVRSGYGEYYYNNGDIYKGNHIEGYPNGYGEYQWKNGKIYIGEFINGEITGNGEYYIGVGIQ